MQGLRANRALRLHRNLVGQAGRLLQIHMTVTDFIVIIHLKIIRFARGARAVQLRCCLWRCVHSLPLALHSVNSLAASVGVRDLDLLEKVLDDAELWLEAHALEPLVVLLDNVLH